MADRKLFIGNLVRRITQDDLWVMYSAFGPLEECAKFHESFGFVRFLHAEDARQALDATHGMTIKGRCIKVEFAATTTSWRSATNANCNECRPTVRYNIPPIRAVDYSTHRDHQRTIISTPALSKSPPRVGPIGHRRKTQTKSNSATSESNTSATNSIDIRQSQMVSSTSPSSSYAASSSHLAETEDHDCDLDSGYNDESEPSSLLSSPWLDIPVPDEMFVWDFQLYADIARELPFVTSDNSSSKSSDDDTIGHLIQFNIEEYL